MREPPRASSMRPIALSATSPGSMSSSSAPAIQSICVPTSPHCSPGGWTRLTVPGSRAASAIWSGSGWTLPICRGARAPDVPDQAGGVMDYLNLGRTGLKVSVAGLGCGGFSRLGPGTGKSTAEAVALIRQALDLGVNLLDTAAVYGTEAVVGEAIKSVPRQSVIVATKAWIPHCGGQRADRRAVARLSL